ncbi:hypothetical protein EJB05_00692, partial [Eragrostis curvula]
MSFGFATASDVRILLGFRDRAADVGLAVQVEDRARESWSHSSPCSTAGILAEKGGDVVEQQQEEEGPEQQKKLATRRRRGRAGAEDAQQAAALSRRAARRGGRRRRRNPILRQGGIFFCGGGQWMQDRIQETVATKSNLECGIF